MDFRSKLGTPCHHFRGGHGYINKGGHCDIYRRNSGIQIRGTWEYRLKEQRHTDEAVAWGLPASNPNSQYFSLT